jgi:hypothetical protein
MLGHAASRSAVTLAAGLAQACALHNEQERNPCFAYSLRRPVSRRPRNGRRVGVAVAALPGKAERDGRVRESRLRAGMPSCQRAAAPLLTLV